MKLLQSSAFVYGALTFDVIVSWALLGRRDGWDITAAFEGYFSGTDADLAAFSLLRLVAFSINQQTTKRQAIVSPFLSLTSAILATSKLLVGLQTPLTILAVPLGVVETFIFAWAARSKAVTTQDITARQKTLDASALVEPLLSEAENGLGPAGTTAEDPADAKAAAPTPPSPLRKASIGRLAGLAWPERRLLVVATVALFISAGANMAIPSFIGQLIDDVVQTDNRAQLDRSCLMLLIIFVVGSVFTLIRGALFNLAGERLVARLRTRLFDAVAVQDVAFFDEQRTGELMNRLSSDCTVVQNAVTVNVSMALRSAASVLLSLLLLFVTSWKLSLIMLAVVPLLVVAARAYGGFAKGLSKRYQDALAESADVAQEAISNCRTVRAFAAESRELRRYSERVQESYRLGYKKSVAYGVFMGGIGLLSYLATLTVLWVGGRLVIHGELSAGSLTSFLLYTIYIATGLGTLSGLWSEFCNAVGASERVFELMDKTPSIPVRGGQRPAGGLKGAIAFEDVQFSYPARPDMPVLRGFSLEISPNTTVALVGQSGAGKSTVLALIERFYDPTSGRVVVDGHDVRELDPSWLRAGMALVMQEPVLFGGTILDNICYSSFNAETGALDLHVSQEAIEEAAALANCHDFIMAFPDGYKTVVGERGVRLSGGQKQRIAIARALLKDPAILLLDEATSALDAESEHLVQQAIENLMKNRTVVVIAHRLSTIKNADVIAVCQEGRIRDMGTHDRLLETSKVYRQLVQRQLQWGGDSLAPLAGDGGGGDSGGGSNGGSGGGGENGAPNGGGVTRRRGSSGANGGSAASGDVAPAARA